MRKCQPREKKHCTLDVRREKVVSELYEVCNYREITGNIPYHPDCQ